MKTGKVDIELPECSRVTYCRYLYIFIGGTYKNSDYIVYELTTSGKNVRQFVLKVSLYTPFGRKNSSSNYY